MLCGELCEFNITQSMLDLILLEAINGYFDNTGGVYGRQNNIGTVSFRVLKIIPFFIEYPLLGRKTKDFERWVELVEIIKKNIGETLEIRDTFIKFAYILKNLNSSRFNPKKEIRLNWLKTLNTKPTIEEKLDLINKINIKD
jgi:hypothetical protein